MSRPADLILSGGPIHTVDAARSTARALAVRDGRIVLLEKVRTSSKALARLLQLTIDGAGTGPIDIAVQHLDAPERAAELAGRLRAALPNAGELYTSEVGAVLGAHLGPASAHRGLGGPDRAGGGLVGTLGVDAGRDVAEGPVVRGHRSWSPRGSGVQRPPKPISGTTQSMRCEGARLAGG